MSQTTLNSQAIHNLNKISNNLNMNKKPNRQIIYSRTQKNLQDDLYSKSVKVSQITIKVIHSPKISMSKFGNNTGKNFLMPTNRFTPNKMLDIKSKSTRSNNQNTKNNSFLTTNQTHFYRQSKKNFIKTCFFHIYLIRISI
jgi:hypothetical protein